LSAKVYISAMTSVVKGVRNALRANQGLLVVLALALVVRVCYLIYYHNMPDWSQLTVDNYYHHHWAQSIAEGNILGDTTYFRAPFYVFCLAFLYALWGTSLWVGRLFGLAVGLGSVAMTYLLGRRIFNTKVGLIAALLQSIYPVMIYFESELLLDPLFTLLLQLAVYRLLIWWESKKTKDALLTGLLVGLASITRPTALIFIPLIVFLLILTFKPARLWVKQTIVFILAASLVIAPLLVRNLIVADDPVLIASQGGINLYIGNNNAADGVSAVLPEPLGHNWSIKEVTYLAQQEAGKRLKPGEVSSYWANKSLNWMTKNPLAFTKLYLKKLYYSFSNREISNNRNLGWFFNQVPILKYNPLSFGILFMLTLVAIVAGFKQRSQVRLLSLSIIAYVLITSIFFFNSRFRLPLVPYYLVLSAFGLVTLIHHLRSKQKFSLGLLLAAFGAALFSFYPLVPLPKGSSPLPLISRGLYYYAKGDYHQAAYYERLALTVDSTFPEVNLNMGACYFKLGVEDSARYYFEREKQFNPERAKAYTDLASLYLMNGQYGKALTEIERALYYKPYDVTTNMVLLRAMSANQEIDNDSLAHVATRAAESTDDNIYLLNDAAALLAQRGSLQWAESLLLKALNAKPPPIETDDEAFTPNFINSPQRWKKEQARANYQLGYINGLRKRYHDAVRYSSLAIRGDSTLVEAYVNLISGLLATGQPHQADSVLAIALGKFPTNKHLHHLQEYLDQ